MLISLDVLPENKQASEKVNKPPAPSCTLNCGMLCSYILALVSWRPIVPGIVQMWVRDHPCPVDLSGLSCKINLEQEKEIKHRQKTEMEKQIAITNSSCVPEVPLMSGVMRCAHIFQGQTLIPDKFSLSHCFYCKTLVPSKLCVILCNIIITSSVMVLPWHILPVLSYSSILQSIFLILLGQPKNENADLTGL